MREIEFRGLVQCNSSQSSSNDWIEGSYVCVESVNEHYIYTERHYPYETLLKVEIREETLSQFAGFRDRRNQKLFEGHIVFDAAHHSALLVYFSNKGTWRVKSSDGKLDATLNSRVSAIEIIGDIHRNPDKFN